MAFLFSRTNRNKRPVGRRPSFVPRLELLEDRTVPSTLTVSSPADDGTAGTLRAVIASANPGDTIKFAKQLKGDTIALTQGQLPITKNLDIEGLGADNLAISGNTTSRIFDISGGVSLTVTHLTISNGLADHGGAILDEAGASLTLSHVVLSNNQAVGGLGGGAIFNDAGAGLNITDSALADNQTTTAVNFDPSTGGGGGGAIFNATGAGLVVTHSELTGNQSITMVGHDSFGGAIYNVGGTATISACMLENNQVFGGGTFDIVGGSAGGALASILAGTLTVTESSFTNNLATCAAGGYIALGGALDNEVSSLATLSDCRFTANQAIGGAGHGEGGGGALENENGGTLSVSDSTFAGNRGIGGDAAAKETAAPSIILLRPLQSPAAPSPPTKPSQAPAAQSLT